MCKKIPLGAAGLHQARSYYSISKPKPFPLLRDWWSPESLSFHGEVLHGADKGPSMAVEHGVLMHLTALGPLSHLAAGGVVWEPRTPPAYLCSHHRWWVTDSQGILTWSAEAISCCAVSLSDALLCSHASQSCTHVLRRYLGTWVDQTIHSSEDLQEGVFWYLKSSSANCQ